MCADTKGGEDQNPAAKELAKGNLLAVFGVVRHTLHRTFDDPVSAFTLVLAISTIGLWAATRRLWIGAEAQAADLLRSVIANERSAEALAKQSEVVIAAELPRHALGGVRLVTIAADGQATLVPPGPIPDGCIPVVELHNTGRSTMLVEDLSLDCQILEGDLPPEPVYRLRFGPRRVLQANTAEAFGLSFLVINPTPAERALLKSGKARLWIWGAFGCRDFMGTLTSFGWVAQWSEVGPNGGPPLGFITIGPNTYNYARPRSEEDETKLPPLSGNVAGFAMASLTV